MKHLESAQQQQVVEWSKWAYKANPTRYPNLDLLHCSLNGVKLTKTQAGIAKGQGMLSGVPDLFLPVPRQSFHGLYIEMKSEKGRVTDNQEWFLSKTNGLGYKTAVCYSAKEAIETIQDYYAVRELEAVCNAVKLGISPYTKTR